MSEPLTNYETEDVLSSVRRLVSGERQADRSTPPPAVMAPLLLTQTMRVFESLPPSALSAGIMVGAASQVLHLTEAERVDAAATWAADHKAAVFPEALLPEDPAWRNPAAETQPATAGTDRGATQARAMMFAESAEPWLAQGSAAAVKAATAAGPAAALQDLTEPEDALLRDRVRQILRDELAGELGERITRNLRKMVRAEVNRALTLHNLD